VELPRRQFLHLGASTAALGALLRDALALEYPVRPVRLIVGFPAGGVTDILARLLSPWLSERLGQQFIVEDQPGAGTNLATEMVVRARPDGYTLLMATSTNAINATLYDNLRFNFIRDTAPVASIARTPLIMETNPSFPAKTVPDFITYVPDMLAGQVQVVFSPVPTTIEQVKAGRLRALAVTGRTRSEAVT
jgi:tripartite-type tricarboxylate transporter receptor subunit TctC